jgi:hypothetical protein
MNDQLLDELNDLINRLEQPLPSNELANGWTPQAQAATLTFLQKIRAAVLEGGPLPDVSSAGRALDHWGVVDGPLLEAACTFYNRTVRSVTDRVRPQSDRPVP